MALGTLVLVQRLAAYQASERSRDSYALLINNWWLLGYAMLILGFAYASGLPDAQDTPSRTLAASAVSTVAAAAAFTLVSTTFGPWLLPRFVVVSAPVVLTPWFVLCAAIARRQGSRRADRERVLLIARREESDWVSGELVGRTERPISEVSNHSIEECVGSDGNESPVLEIARLEQPSLIVLSEEAQRSPSIVDQVGLLHERGVRVRPLTDFYDQWLGKLPVSELTRMHLMFDIGDVHATAYGRVKRFVDLAFVAIASPVAIVAVPLVWIANQFGNRGPLFFRQERVGLNGKVFEIYKFRSMRPSFASAGEWTMEGDVRITTIGRILRKSHLDELPQIWNIARGEICLIGPRPEQLHYVEQLRAKIPHYDVRHTVRPGLTGWAQVKYPYGSNEADALEKLEYELYYLRHQGLWLDLQIITRTAKSLLTSGR